MFSAFYASMMKSYIPAALLLALLGGQTARAQQVLKDDKYNVIYMPDTILLTSGNNPLPDNLIWALTSNGSCQIDSGNVSFANNPISAPLESTITCSVSVKGCCIGDCPTGTGHHVEKVGFDWQFFPLSDSIPSFKMKNTSAEFHCQEPRSLNCSGNITIQMPPYIGVYRLKLTVQIHTNHYGVKTSVINRKVYVTYRETLDYLGTPQLNWYDLACNWASGPATDVLDVITRTLSNLYQYGGEHWKYTGVETQACTDWKHAQSTRDSTWQFLLDENNPCNSGTCFDFSNVLHSMCAVLGIGGFMPEMVLSTGTGNGFVTPFNIRSLDPAFIGNVAPINDTSAYDAYFFGNHSLLEMNGYYFDATFNQIYTSPRQCVMWDANQKIVFSGADYFFQTSVEGSGTPGPDLQHLSSQGVYQAYPGGLYYWDGFYYLKTNIQPPGPGEKSPPAAASLADAGQRQPSAAFNGPASFSPVNNKAGSPAGRLSADLEINLFRAGNYTIRGELLKNGKAVASVSAWKRPEVSTVTPIRKAAGTHRAALHFSGEQIYRAGIDGPYTLKAYLSGANGLEGTLEVETPPYSHERFGEVGAQLAGIASEEITEGNHVKLRVSLTVTVRIPGQYRFQCAVLSGMNALASEGRILQLSQGTHLVVLDLPAGKIRRDGSGNPLYLVANVFDGGIDHVDGKKVLVDGR